MTREGSGGRETDEETRIKDVLRDQPLGMNIKEIAAAIGMSRNSVAKYLDVLTATGHLDVRLLGNAKLYYLSHRIPAQDLLQITREMIVMLDDHLRIVQASDSFTAFLRCGHEQVAGIRLSRLPHPILSEKDEGDLAGLLAGGPAWTKEIRIVKNGSPVYLTARFIPVVFDSGTPGITVIFENITRQRQAEIALMENERFLFNVLQVSPTPKFLIDRNHKVVFWNRALEILTKHPAEEMIGTSLQWKAFYPGPRPCLADVVLDGDTALFAEYYPGCTVPRALEDTCEVTEFFPAPGTPGRWLRCTATVIRDSGGMITGAVETLEDITAIKQREFRIEPGS